MANIRNVTSRYRDTGTETAGGFTYPVGWVRPEEFKSGNFTVKERYTVTSSDCGRLDLLAYKYYNDVELWWVIAAANNMIDVIGEMIPGRILDIPSYEDVVKFTMRIGKEE